MADKKQPADDLPKPEKLKDQDGDKSDVYNHMDTIVGSYGRYQFMIFMFKVLIGVVSAFNNLGVTFFAPTEFVGFWCADAPSANLTAFTPWINGSQVAHQRSYESNFFQLFGQFLSNPQRDHKHSLNLNFDTPPRLRKQCGYTSPADGQWHKCQQFRYDTGIWISTIVDEWDLVCDRAWFISVTQSLYMAGFILAYLLFGYLSDRFGRWRSMLIGASIEILSGLGCAYAPSVTSFMFFRFFLGLGNAGRSSSSYLIMIEWTGQRWRMYISTLGSLGWALGYCAMPWITLHFLHFRHMQLFVCCYEFALLVWLFFVPESPRWLLTHKHFGRAKATLLHAANFNGLISAADQKQRPAATPAAAAVAAPDRRKGASPLAALALTADQKQRTIAAAAAANSQLTPYTMAEFHDRFDRLCELVTAKEFTKNEDKLSIFDLFRWTNLRKYTIILTFNWAANSFIYYGIVLRVGDLGGRNLFKAFTYAGLTELPSIAFTMICMRFLPRRTTNLFFYSTILLLCCLQVPLKYYDQQELQQWSMLLAKLFNSCAFTVILYQTMELFPTSIRQTAYCFCSLVGRFGSILAPFNKELAQHTSKLVPPLIYALLTVLELTSISLLPETKGTDLPDTLLEAEKFKGTRRKPSLSIAASHPYHRGTSNSQQNLSISSSESNAAAPAPANSPNNS